MRKIDPADVKADFDSSLNDVASFYTTARTAISGDQNQTFLVENTFLSIAVLWESYISDLFLAYINRNSSRFRDHLKDALKSALVDKPKRIFDDYASIDIPEHLSKDVILKLVDHRGSNITFRNYNDLRDGANRFLTVANRAGIDAVPAADQSTIDAAIAIRNHIAHRSRQSYIAMNDALNLGGLHNTGLRRGANKVRQIGPWLKAKPQPQQPPRIELFLTRLRGIAAQL